ncbi:MAG: DUF1206 domain-containing protein [Leptolyngbyaceae cyanobacterium]
MRNSLKRLKLLSSWLTLGQQLLFRLFRQTWAQRYIRFGHAAKGFLYGLIGLFSMRAVFYDGKSAGGSKAVLATLNDRTIGSVILLLLGVGLFGYSFWRLVQILIDPDHDQNSNSIQNVVQRCGYLCSCLTYLGVGYTSLRLAIGLTVDFDDTVEEIAEALFKTPVGPLVLSAAGLGVIVVGLVYIYGAFSESFIDEFKPELYSAVKQSTVAIGKLGYTARGVSFTLIGAYLLKSAYFVDDEEAGGLGQVLDRLDDQPYGKIWLTAIAVGFFAYALYMTMSALYRQLPTKPSR